MLEIVWPERFHPERAPVHVRNELRMQADPRHVWAWLIRAASWPEWYANASQVRLIEPVGSDLAPGSRFRWKTFGFTIESRVREFSSFERIAWDGRALGIEAYHAWTIAAAPQGCHVLTEETQYGMLARLGRVLMPGRMHKFHQIWLESLAEQASQGMPR